MLRALIWKDVLANRFPLLLAAALFAASYGVALILGSLDPSLSALPPGRRLFTVLFAGSLASHAVAQLSLAVLSGNLIAVERADRSAEFLAYLPPSRSMVLRAKASLLAFTAILLFLLPLAIGGLAGWISGSLQGDGFRRSMLNVGSISAIGFCGSGIGWLGSCCLQSNAVAILFAILTPWILAILVSVSGGAESPAILVAANLSLGLAGFLFGTRHYLHRVEP
jgi:hypothetical protein